MKDVTKEKLEASIAKLADAAADQAKPGSAIGAQQYAQAATNLAQAYRLMAECRPTDGK